MPQDVDLAEVHDATSFCEIYQLEMLRLCPEGQGGRFVEFTLAAGFSLNPFSMVDDARAEADEDYRLDCFAMVKAIVGQMARQQDRLSDTERGLIDSAVSTVWREKQRAGTIDHVASRQFQAVSPFPRR